jgi:hypothetical protein
MALPENESIQSAHSWYLILTGIAKILSVIGSFAGIYLVFHFFVQPVIGPIEDLSCILPHSPWEMLLGVGGMIGLTALGLPFAPATVFGLATWAIIKYWICQY